MKLASRDDTLGPAYWEGAMAAERYLPESACPYGETHVRKRCDWLGGHYDRARELGTQGVLGYEQAA